MIEQRISVDDLKRRRALVAACGVLCGVGAIGAAVPVIQSMLPSDKTKTAEGVASLRVDITALQPGEMMQADWHGGRIAVLRRTQEQLASLLTIQSLLEDPLSEKSNQPEASRNVHRSLVPEYLVVSLICTHLGCSVVPIEPKQSPYEGRFDAGGFDCPCHTSYFDHAGRVYKGMPAPRNLDVPNYVFLTPTEIELRARA